LSSPGPPFGLCLYRLAVTIAFFLVSPVWLLGLLIRPDEWKSRLGLVPSLAPTSTGESNRVWVHASSVGEVRAATRLIREMHRKGESEVVVSTMTSAGHSVAKASLRDAKHVFFLPLDAPFVVGTALRRIKPDVLLLVETELWPCLILEAKKRGVRVAIVNGKLSAGGLKGYGRFRFVFAPILSMLDAVLVQSERHAANYQNLGVPAERVAVTGNTKQDLQQCPGGELFLRQVAGWSGADVVLTAGSTRTGEEQILCEGFIAARRTHERLRLVLAPRHLRRTSQVVRVTSDFDLSVARLSNLRAGTPGRGRKSPGSLSGERIDVLIIDTIGDLVAAYCESDVAFIGGTLSGHGGHNVLEPAAAGLPVLAGPSMENIEDDCRALSDLGALAIVRDSSDVTRELELLMESPEERSRRGKQAEEFFRTRPVASVLTLERLERTGIL
jgi:3-deoxy-D-manno-octulosonic-acid transferase